MICHSTTVIMNQIHKDDIQLYFCQHFVLFSFIEDLAYLETYPSCSPPRTLAVRFPPLSLAPISPFDTTFFFVVAQAQKQVHGKET